MNESTGLVLSDTTYNRLKWTITIVLPALATLYFGLSQLFGLPKGTEVVGALALIATFGGTILGVSSKAYNAHPDYDGALTTVGADEDTGMPHLSMTINKTPDELLGKKVVRLKVDPNAAPGVLPEQ